MAEFIVLELDDLRIALPLAAVERVIRTVLLTHLPDAPEIVRGVVNVQGRVIPVVDMRSRFRLPGREISLTDRLVVANTGQRPVAIMADAVSGVLEYPEPELIGAESILPGLEYIGGVAKLDDGLILVHNLGRFLSLDEEEELDRAMTPAGDP